MSFTWQIQEAKSRFSEVVDDALRLGPQIITRRGIETAVLMSYHDYRRLQIEQASLAAFFRQSPLVEAELDLERDPSPPRNEIEL